MPHSLDKPTRKQQIQNASHQAKPQQHPTPLPPVMPGVIQRATTLPSQLTASDVLYLQRTIGNRAVAQLLGRSGKSQEQPSAPAVQPKLKVGAANDRFEQEADAVAKQVTRTPSPSLQRKPDSPSPMVGVEGGSVDGDVTASIQRERSGGSPLPQSIRRTLEPHLGRDLSQVRTHSNEQSAQLNSQLGAKAFTYGRDIFYGAGQSPSDIQLTAHEATHFVQQQNPPSTGGKADAVQRSPNHDGLSLSQPRIQRHNNNKGKNNKDIALKDSGALKLPGLEGNEDDSLGDTRIHEVEGSDDEFLDDTRIHELGGSEDVRLIDTWIPDSESSEYDLLGGESPRQQEEEAPPAPLAADYLGAHGPRHWKKDTSYRLVSRRPLRKIDKALERYKKIKQKDPFDAEAQGQLLLQMKTWAKESGYLGDNKNTKAFNRRKSATDRLKQEVDLTLVDNPKRLAKSASRDGQEKSLKKTGMVKEFLDTVSSKDLEDLYLAHAALSHGQLQLAQRAFDRLNPVERDRMGELKYKLEYVKRSRSRLHFAQQMLTAYHHKTIGGEYGRSFAPSEISPQRMNKIATNYMRNPDFLGGILQDVDRPPHGLTLDQAVSRYQGQLSSEEVEALRIYTSDGFKRMNATMQDIRLDDPTTQKGFKGYTSISQVAVNALSKLPSYAGPILYRGDGDFGGIVETARLGASFRTPNFMSTSKDFDKAANFGTSVAWIVLPAPNSSGKDIRWISTHSPEEEVLFPPGTKMQVVDVVRGPDVGDFPKSERAGRKRILETWKTDSGEAITLEHLKFMERFGNLRNTLIILQEVK